MTSSYGKQWEGGFTACKDCGCLHKDGKTVSTLTSGGVCIDRNFCRRVKKEKEKK